MSSEKLNPSNLGVVDLNAPASPAILAGIFGVSVPMIFQYRQENKLPPNTDASYRECIKTHLNYFKARSNSKVGSMAERKMLQEIRVGIAKEEQQWLDIRRTRDELIDVGILADIAQPLLALTQSSFSSIARKYPETSKDIQTILGNLYELGKAIATKANMDASVYVQTMIEKQIDAEEVEQMLTVNARTSSDDTIGLLEAELEDDS